MAVAKIKASMEWGCPHCGLQAKGTLTMNSAGMVWLEAAWDAHVKECRTKKQTEKNGAKQS